MLNCLAVTYTSSSSSSSSSSSFNKKSCQNATYTEYKDNKQKNEVIRESICVFVFKSGDEITIVIVCFDVKSVVVPSAA